jgi:hypothetical protein
VPAKIEESQVPEETGAGPVDHEAIIAFVNALEANASIPVVPVAYFVVFAPLL